MIYLEIQRLKDKAIEAFYDRCDGTKCCDCEYRDLEEIEMCGINFAIDFLEREGLLDGKNATR